MKAKILSYHYEQADSVIARGREVGYYQRKGYIVGYGGNGSYRMNLPASATVTVDVGGQIFTESVWSLIKDLYGLQRISKKRLIQFVDECDRGIIDLRYDYNVGLYTM